MTDSWWLVVSVLAAGLGLGILLTWVLRRSETANVVSERLRADLKDLEGRQEELYRRLRGTLDRDEREAVELEAARNLQAVERLRATLPKGLAAQRVPSGPVPVGPVGTAPRIGASGRLLGAFAAGVATTLLLGWLVLTAQRDAQPRADGTDGPGAPTADHPEGAELSPAERQRLEGLRARLAGNPEDLSARKQYAVALLGAGQFVGAFGESEEILRRIPLDPDGLYVQGMVRLQMGQDATAVELLDQVLARYPEHVLALTAKGVALHRGGNPLGARFLWQQALAASDGRNPQIERLLTLLDAPASDERPSADTAAPPSRTAYRLHVELAGGATPAPGAALFVFLRGDAAGPPAAVKRLSAPVFPLDLELTAADSMLGAPLPERGTVGVRLDADGNASTRDARDLEVEAPAAAGVTTTLRLDRH